MTPRLIQTQSPAPHLSVSVWREAVAVGNHALGQCQYRKIWKDDKARAASPWLSWAHHEHLMLSLLSQRSIAHVVKVSGLQVADTQVELVTLDAGPDFLRDWLLPAQQTGKPTLWRSESDALKWMRACLKALLSLHSLGVIHGDLKADNLCVSEDTSHRGGAKRLNLSSLTMIDFAYALYKEAPLKCVLPTDPERLDYLPDFYRQAIQTSQTTQDPGVLLSVACANIDLYSLRCLLAQTVEPGVSRTWRTWSKVLKQLHQVGSQQHKPFSFWGTRAFDQPTRDMLKTVDAALLRLKLPRDQWDSADTVLNAQAAVTPLMVEPTPVIALTPLINREVMVLPASPVATPVMPLPTAKSTAVSTALPTAVSTALPTAWPPAAAPVSPPLRPAVKSTAVNAEFPRWLTLSGFVLNAAVFHWIDRAYKLQSLVLSNAAYVCGLLSALAGVILAIQTLRVLFKPAPEILRRWSLIQALLMSSAFFFFTTVHLSIEKAGVLVLLVIQVWIWVRVWRLCRRSHSIE